MHGDDFEEVAKSLSQMSSIVQGRFTERWKELEEVLKEQFPRLLALELAATHKKGSTDPRWYIERAPLADSWNDIGRTLLRLGLYGTAETLYRYAHEREHEFECEYGVRLHKGYSLHNLGLAQVSQGNWEDGLQNINRAVAEDEESHVRNEDSHAYKVLHSRIIDPKKDYIKNHLRHRCKESGLALITDQTIDDLFDSFDYEQRLFAAFTISTAMFSEPDTQFGRIRRLNALRDSCYLFETWLRKCGHQGKGLKPCLDSAYGRSGLSWWSTLSQLWEPQTTSATSESHVINALGRIAFETRGDTADDLVVRSHLQTGLMRNWTHHHFDPGAGVFKHVSYEELFESVWICLACAHATGIHISPTP